MVISTSGDRIQDRPLSEVGGKGLFTKEIEGGLLPAASTSRSHSSRTCRPRYRTGWNFPVSSNARTCAIAFIGRASAKAQGIAGRGGRGLVVAAPPGG